MDLSYRRTGGVCLTGYVCSLLIFSRVAFGLGPPALRSSAVMRTCVRTSCGATSIWPLFRQHSEKRTQLNVFSAYDEDEYYEEEEKEEEEELTDEELAATMGEWDERIARFNTIHLTGRVGNNPEPRYFDDGNVVVNLSLATKCKYHGLERKAFDIKAGEEETDWYGLEIWVRTPELCYWILFKHSNEKIPTGPKG